jgi:hypothetical protein
MSVVERVRAGARWAGRWSPALLLVLLLVAGVATGAGAEALVLVALAVTQVLFLTLPRAARWAGRRMG